MQGQAVAPSEVLEPFHLLSSDVNMSVQDGTANAWVDIWKYQVPRGTEIILSPGDQFSAYIEDASTVVGNKTCSIRIFVRDPAEGEETIVYGPNFYERSKEQQDDDLIARLRMLEAMRVKPRYWIVVSAKDDGTIDASDSFFDLYCHRARATVG
jgi:hypothetical protein